MKTIVMTTVLAVVLVAQRQQAHSQGTFVNLDFENPILPLIPGADGRVSITDAMPGWAGYIGGVPTDRVFYDTVSLGAAAISIHDANGIEPILQGSYTVYCQKTRPTWRIGASRGL